jgi:ATP-binding cassette, subfamily B, multidrug efflux pump
MSDPGSASAGVKPRSTTAWALLRRFWSFARPHRRWVFLGLVMIPLVAGLTTLRPLLLRHAVDVNIPEGDVIGLRLMGIAFLGAVVAEFFCQAAQVYALQRAGHGTINDVRRTVFEHVLRLPNRFFDRHAIGSLLTRTTSDVESVSETLSFGVFTILTDIVLIASILTAMFVLDAWLAVIALALAPVLVLLVQTFGRALRRLQLEVRRARAAQDGYLAEQLTGITVVQLFHREDAAHREYERRGRRYLKATKWANVYDALLFSVMDGIAAFSIALMIWFAAPSVLTGGEGVLTLGLLFAFIDYLQRIFEPIKQFSSKLATIQRAAASLERIYGLLDEPTEKRPPLGPGASPHDPLAAWSGGLRLRDVSFSYKEDGPDVLRDVSFEIAPGEVVAVVGRTGSGKTTLGRLLTRFYEGYRGAIELDLPDGPRELTTVAPESLRRHALLVQQDVFLFSGDVAFNVSLGESGLDDPQRLRRALEVVQADRLIDRRGGLDFEVGERGRNLSAGEAQLLAFARVAARQPTLLILDEATANVDSVTEQKVQAAIERLLEGRSVLVIAHRLSTVRRADKILVMKGGRIVEQGKHEDLIARGGVYAELYRMGFEDASEEA